MMNNFYNTEVGLDKMKLCCFPVKIFDLNKLYSYNTCTVVTEATHTREFEIKGELYEFGTITINDPIFKLIIDTHYVKDVANDYQTLELNPAKILFDENIRNVTSATLLAKALEIVENKLLEYGIEASLTDAVIEEIEINQNISLDCDFNSYKNSFNIIAGNLPGTFKKIGHFTDGETKMYTGFKAENNMISLKFYDKCTERKKDINLNLLRIEYRLKDRKKVQAMFEFNTIDDLINNFKKITEAFQYMINKHIVSKSNKFLKNLYTKMLNNLKAAKKTERSYIKYLLATMQDEEIFDYEFLHKAIAKLSLASGTTSKRRKQAIQLLKKREQNASNLFFDNIKRYNEVIQKLGFTSFEF